MRPTAIALFLALTAYGLTEPQKNVLHFSVCAAASSGMAMAMDYATDAQPYECALFGFTAGMVLGTVKECVDYRRGFTFSASDMGYNMLGALSGVVVYGIVRRIRGKHGA